jgi:hypothetical protein
MTEREAPPPSTVDDQRFTPGVLLFVVLTGVLAAGWFLVSWLVLHSPVTDAIAETLGSLAVILLVVSIFGAVHRD